MPFKCLYNAKWRESDGELWADYPYQPLEDNIQVYYMVELALYLSLMCTLFIGKQLTVCLSLHINVQTPNVKTSLNK